MGERRYCAPAADALLTAPLAPFTAVFHRPSGITHLLAEPAPQILAALGEAAMSPTELKARLSETFDLGDHGEAVLAERLAELEAAGLITPA